MTAHNLIIKATDGFPLAATLFPAAQPNGTIVQFNSATGVPRQFYRHFANWLSEHGFTTLTFDYRGIGESIPDDIQSVEGSMAQWGTKDAAAIADYLAGRFPGVQLLAIGHSVGGQIFGLMPNNALFSGLIGFATQSGYWKLWPKETREARRILWSEIVPAAIQKHGYFPGRIMGSADLPAGIAQSWASWCLSPDYIVDEAGLPIREGFHAIELPFHFFRVTDDDIAPEAAVEALIGFYRKAKVERHVIDPIDHGGEAIGHFNFFRRANASLWPRLLTVLQELDQQVKAAT